MEKLALLLFFYVDMFPKGSIEIAVLLLLLVERKCFI